MPKGYYDPIRKIAFRADGSIAYANDFGGITVANAPTRQDNWQKEAASREIMRMNQAAYNKSSHVPLIG